MLLDIQEPGKDGTDLKESVGVVGIDLGTTNSVVSISDGGEFKTFSDEGGDIIPSVVAYDNEEIYVGQSALGKANAIHSVKRLMGRNIDDEKSVRTSSEILKKLKNIAEKSLCKPVTKAVITVPAYFDDAARAATKDAAKLAGLEVLRLINEPTAASLAYGLDNDAEGTYAVYDFGGGTFDISILKMEKGVFRVLSTAGNTELGGDDFDNLIAKKLGCDVRRAREIKEQLTEKEEVGGLSRGEFEQIVENLVMQTVDTCRQAVSDASVELDEIKGVVLVGGSTKIPLVRQKVAEYFNKEPLANIDPDRVVAYGAAIQAENLTKGTGSLLLDVAPLSLGLETMGGLVEKIIERNTPIPVSKSQEFTTYQDGQSAMTIHVLQGEREMVDQCRSLARFNLTEIPAMKAGLARINVTFTVDADGLLTVSAKEESTGKIQDVQVKPSYGLQPEKMEAMLRESFVHAKEDILSRLLLESRLEAQQMLDYLFVAFKKDGDLLDNQEKNRIEIKINELKEAMAGSNRDVIDIKAQELDNTCSGFAEKRVNRALTEALSGKTVDTVDVELNRQNS